MESNNEQTKLMNISNAAKLIGVEYQTLRAAFKRGVIAGDNEKNLVDYKSAQNYFEGKNKKAFSDLDLDFDEYLRPLDFISQNFNNQPQRLITQQSYLISNKGKIYNASLDKTMSPYINEKGYFKVTLSGINSKINLRIHVLVALGFCPNRMGKSTVHHIDGNSLNNNAKNLIWLTKSQHLEAHRLMKMPNKKEYRLFIKTMQKENSWDGEYRPIVLERDNRTLYFWISKDVWQEYQNGLRTLNDIYYYEIGAERVIFNQEGIKDE